MPLGSSAIHAATPNHRRLSSRARADGPPTRLSMECLWRAVGTRALLRPRAATRTGQVPARAPQIGALLRRPGDRGDRRARRVVLGRARGASPGTRADQGRTRLPALRHRHDLLAGGTQGRGRERQLPASPMRAGSRRSSCTSTATADASAFPWRSPPTTTSDERIVELRLYFSSWALSGRHANRPPLLQPDPDLHAPDVVGEYQRALAERRRRRDPRRVRAGRLHARAGRRRPRPPGDRRAARALRAVLLQRRRHPAGALHRHRRRPRLRAGVQRRRLGRARRCPPRRASPSTCAATAASSPPRASTTTPTRR